MTRPSKLSIAIVVFALVGIALSAISIVNHYRTDPTSYCSFDENFDCDIVNRSIYSRFLGVPVALIGLVGYVATAVLALVRRRAASILLFTASLAGLGFSLYLTYIEARVLHVWCILCLGSLAMIVLITAFASVRLAQREA